MAEVGGRVRHIRIDGELGAGGMGRVYRGFDERLHREVAVKTIHPDRRLSEDTKARFLREARILSSLRHPSICQVYDLIETEEEDYLVLELVEGRTLRDAARELDDDAKLRVAEQMAAALAAAHQKGVIHRDLKPENVMVTDGGVKVLDFGIARVAGGDREPRLTDRVTVPDASEGRQGGAVVAGDEASRPAADFVTGDGSVVGTIGYMSPEQARGEQLTPASDLYALGVLLQEVFSGRPALRPELTPMHRLVAVASGKLEPITGLDPDLTGLIRELESFDPSGRPDAESVAYRLRWIRTKPERRRRRRMWWIGGAAALATLLVTAVVTWRLAVEPPLLEKGQRGRVAVLPFANATGDPSLAWIEYGLLDLVTVTLAETPGIELVDRERVAEIAAHRGGGQEVWAEAARALGTELVVVPTVTGTAGDYRLSYSVTNVSGAGVNRSLAADELTQLARMLSLRLATRLRPASPAVDLRDRFSEDPLLNQVYAMGVDRFTRAGARAASLYFALCLDRDPQFRWAELRLAACEVELGEAAAAERRAQGLLARAREEGDETLEVEVLNLLGVSAISQGDTANAGQYLDQAIRLATARKDLAGEARATNNLGRAALGSGDLVAAENRFSRCLELARRVGDRASEAYAVNNLGLVRWREGRLDEAQGLFEEALEITGIIGLRDLQGLALNNLGILAFERRDYPTAERHLERSLEIFEGMGSSRSAAERLANLGILAAAMGNFELGERRLLDALGRFTELGHEPAIGYVCLELAELELKMGDAARAREYLDRGAPLFQVDAYRLTLLEAWLAALSGDPVAARRLLTEARGTAAERWSGDDEELAAAVARVAG